MLTLIYDAYEGQSFRDGHVHQVVEGWIRRLKIAPNVPIEVVFSTDNILNAIRVAIKHKRIDHTDVRLLNRRGVTNLYIRPDSHPDGPAVYEGTEIGATEHDQELRIYPSAGIRPWPNGFCDRLEFYLMELI